MVSVFGTNIFCGTHSQSQSLLHAGITFHAYYCFLFFVIYIKTWVALFKSKKTRRSFMSVCNEKTNWQPNEEHFILYILHKRVRVGNMLIYLYHWKSVKGESKRHGRRGRFWRQSMENSNSLILPCLKFGSRVYDGFCYY